MHRIFSFPLIFTILGLVIIGCQTTGPAQQTRPTIIISSPPSGSVFSLGQEVTISSTATDPAGVTQVALLVDGVQVRQDPSPVAQGQAQFSLIQSWIAESVGQHTLTVRATNSQGATSDAGILVNIKAQSGTGEPPTVVAIATAVPIGTVPSQPTGAPQTDTPVGNLPSPIPATPVPTCVLSSKFIADVTIPDGTVFTPGAVFTKTWRVQNNGTCAWENFALVFLSGARMAAGSIYPVPTTLPGATADLVVPMTAPSNYGVYGGTWRIRSSAGQLFGTSLTVLINVPSPATAVPPTHTPAPTHTPQPTVAGCSGQPNDFDFSANTTTITAGQSVKLSWGPVTNASEVRLDGGEFSNEGVAAPGNRTVSPNSTTTYTLKAKCNNGGATREESVTITVNAGVGNFAGNWVHNFGTMKLNQLGDQVNGTYHNSFVPSDSIVQGTVVGNKLTGTWGNNDGTIVFNLTADGKRFTGNWDGTEAWCGARPGENFPNNCSFHGNWTSDYGDGNCAMSLQRKDNAVTGTYCIGTLQGNISYDTTTRQTVLTGTYSNQFGLSDAFKFYLFGYNALQFNGNYTGTGGTKYEWCGWRSSSSKPNPCMKQ